MTTPEGTPPGIAPRDPSAPQEPALAAPVVAAQGTRLPIWPGWLLVVLGIVFLFAGLVVATAVGQGLLPLDDLTAVIAVTAAGGIGLVVGLILVAVRSILARRILPLERYRGPSVLVLFVLAVVLSSAAAFPFTADAVLILAGEPGASLAGSFAILTATQAGLLLVAALFVYAPGALRGAPGLTRRSVPGAVLAGLGWGVAGWLGAGILGALMELLLRQLNIAAEPQAVEEALFVIDPVVAVVAVVLVAPIAEEVFFRGVAFNAWLREYGPRRAYVGSALLFGAVHASLLAFVPILFLGFALAWVYRRTGSLLSAIVMHATVNGISVTLALLLRFGVIELPPGV